MRADAIPQVRRCHRATIVACLVLAGFGHSSASGQGPGDVSEAALEAASGRTVRIGVTDSGRQQPTDIPIEVYVARVLAGEGEPRAADAAQEALAIAIRTYVVANLDRHQSEGFDLCDETHCQVMRTATATSRRAALATAGQLLLYQGEPAELFYSASCGGRSETASAVWPGMPDYPYLQPVDDDVHGDDSLWTLDITATDIREALGRAGFSGRRLTDLAIEERNSSGRVSRLSLKGLRPEQVSGAAFRMAIGPTALRSTAFSLERVGRGYRFTGHGYGHGVGMCVIGAGRRAAAGASAEMILGHYYPGLRIGSSSGAAEIVSAPTSAPVARRPPTGSQSARPADAAAQRVEAARMPMIVTVAPEAGVSDTDLERLAGLASADLSRTLGVSIAPLKVRMYGTVDDFRRATGKPWWVLSAVVDGGVVLSPAALVGRPEDVEVTLRIAIAELLLAGSVPARPVWVGAGAARYYGRGASADRSAMVGDLRCPTDVELLQAASASAQRAADARAERCFMQRLAETGDWRAVR